MPNNEVKPKTLAEFKAELLQELKSENAKLEARLKTLEAGFGELKDCYRKHSHSLSGGKPPIPNVK